MRHIVLDTGVLGLVVHPSTTAEPRACKEWMRTLLKRGHQFSLLEIVDYELRRKLLHLNLGVVRLDALKSAIGYVPITTAMMLLAAELWARARKDGIATADTKALDVDVIIAAQTIMLGNFANMIGGTPIIATTNVRHLSRFVDARRWQDID